MQAAGLPIPPNAEIIDKNTGKKGGASEVPPDVALRTWYGLYPEVPMDVQARIKMREGKRTWVCMGTSPDSCGLAPWNEDGIEEWIGLNDAHQLAFMRMDKITRWCQIHQKWRYMRKNPRYDIDHWAWLQKNHPFPIYMQRHDPDVPSSVPIPLREICERFLAGKFSRGDAYERVLQFGSTFSYIIPMALMEGAQRVEFYGVELAQEVEYIEQRPSTHFWIGLASALGMEVYVPRVTRILRDHFYGYEYPKPQTEEHFKLLEDNVGEWKDFPDPNDELKDYIIRPDNWAAAAETWHALLAA